MDTNGTTPHIPNVYAITIDSFVVVIWRKETGWGFVIAGFKQSDYRDPFILDRGTALTNWEAERVVDWLLRLHTDGAIGLPPSRYHHI